VGKKWRFVREERRGSVEEERKEGLSFLNFCRRNQDATYAGLSLKKEEIYDSPAGEGGRDGCPDFLEKVQRGDRNRCKENDRRNKRKNY